jgi:hypothetical protein
MSAYVVRVGVLSSQAAYVADPARCLAPYTTLLRLARRYTSAASAAEAARRVPAVYGATVARLAEGPGRAGGVLALVLALTTAALAVAEQFCR